MKIFFYLPFVLLLIIFISEALIVSMAKVSEFDTPDYILVLGCNSDVDQPLFRERILRGQQAKMEYPTAQVVLSGTPEEIQKMSQYFDSPILDSTAKRTRDHFIFLGHHTQKKGLKILIATNDFHGSRALALSAQFGFQAKLQTTPSIYITSYSMQIREILGRLRMTWDLLINK